MEADDRRVQTRAQFFVIRKDNQQIPVFALRASDDVRAIPGLVVDLSPAGVQVLTSSKAVFDAAHYAMELVSGIPEDTEPARYIALTLVWSRADGMHTRGGFTFHPEQAQATCAQVQERVNASDHQLLRCVLHPTN